VSYSASVILSSSFKVIIPAQATTMSRRPNLEIVSETSELIAETEPASALMAIAWEAPMRFTVSSAASEPLE
jgi:hypothetical protein